MGGMSRPWQQLHHAWVLLSTAWATQEGMTDPLHHSISAFWDQSPEETPSRRPTVGTDTFCQLQVTGTAPGTMLLYSHVVEDTPAAVGVPGAQAQLTALILLTALHRHACHLRGTGTG